MNCKECVYYDDKVSNLVSGEEFHECALMIKKGVYLVEGEGQPCLRFIKKDE